MKYAWISLVLIPYVALHQVAKLGALRSRQSPTSHLPFQLLSEPLDRHPATASMYCSNFVHSEKRGSSSVIWRM